MRRLRTLLKALAVAAAVLAVAAYAVFQLPAFGGRADGARLARMQASPQFTGGRFENTPPQNTDSSILRTLRLYRQGFVRTPTFPIPVVPMAAERLQITAPPGLRAFWFGHATVLVELDGVRILTDPVLSDRVSPVPIGPSRFHPPPIALAHLTGIDAVVISHDHYDHLDMATVQHLAGAAGRISMPVSASAPISSAGPCPPRRFTRWTGGTPPRWRRDDHLHAVASLLGPPVDGQLHAVELVDAARRRRRRLLQRRHRLRPHFAEIRRRLGAVDLNLMKIGAYGETWLDIHMDPESAVRAHRDLGARLLLPVHWATFDLSYHAWEEPIVRTLKAAAANGTQVVTPRIGEAVDASRTVRQHRLVRAPGRPVTVVRAARSGSAGTG